MKPAGLTTHTRCAHTPPTEFCTTEKKKIKEDEKQYTAFIKQLQQWCLIKKIEMKKEKQTCAPRVSNKSFLLLASKDVKAFVSLLKGFLFGFTEKINIFSLQI